eukprot:m.108043 g.108043  ORF g.108043 m.108043 type:complete len:539 (+) comp27842_c0_seq1:245-1861(+)
MTASHCSIRGIFPWVLACSAVLMTGFLFFMASDSLSLKYRVSDRRSYVDLSDASNDLQATPILPPQYVRIVTQTLSTSAVHVSVITLPPLETASANITTPSLDQPSGPITTARSSIPHLVGRCCERNEIIKLDANYDPQHELLPETGCNFMLGNEALVHNPQKIDGQLDPCLAMDWRPPMNTISDNSSLRPLKLHEHHDLKDQHYEPQFSIVVNVFNHQSTITHVVTQILKLTSEVFELILFFDGCTDESFQMARKAVERYRKGWGICDTSYDGSSPFDPSTGFEECVIDNRVLNHKNTKNDDVVDTTSATTSQLHRVRFIVQPSGNSVFETSGNNIAMRAATGRFIVLMQDDMYLTQHAWNSVLARAPRAFADVLSVSGMCAHGLFEHGNGKVGVCGNVRKMMYGPNKENACTFFIRQTSNRGPLLLDAKKVQQLGYLDEYNIRMFNDDHDLHCRAFLDQGWVTGYTSIGFYVNINEGGVRQNRQRSKSDYETFFTKTRNGRKNKKDCFWSRRVEFKEHEHLHPGTNLSQRRIPMCQ